MQTHVGSRRRGCGVEVSVVWGGGKSSKRKEDGGWRDG